MLTIGHFPSTSCRQRFRSNAWPISSLVHGSGSLPSVITLPSKEPGNTFTTQDGFMTNVETGVIEEQVCFGMVGSALCRTSRRRTGFPHQLRLSPHLHASLFEWYGIAWFRGWKTLWGISHCLMVHGPGSLPNSHHSLLQLCAVKQLLIRYLSPLINCF